MSDAALDRAVTALATLGAVFWSTQLIPQIILNWRRKSSDGLQPSMMILWSLAGLPLGVHNILSNQSIALQVQAQILTSLSLVTWSQVMYYDHHWSIRKCSITLAALMLLFGATEAAFVLGFKYGTDDNQTKSNAILAMAILAALGLSLGVLRHYYDIAKHRTVRGISWGFVGLDAAGDLTSLLAVTIRSPADRVAAGIYASELGLWIGVMLAGIVFNLRVYLLNRFSPPEAAADSQEGVEQGQQQVEGEGQEEEVDSHNTSLSRQSSAFNAVIPDTTRSHSLRLRTRRLFTST